MVPNSKLDQFFEEVDENRDVCMPLLLVSCFPPSSHVPFADRSSGLHQLR